MTTIRPAQIQDSQAMLALVKELAVYEKAPDEEVFYLYIGNYGELG